jgi:ribosomal protein L10
MPTPTVNFSFKNTLAKIAVNAGPVEMMDDDIDGPMRSMLMK